MSARLAASAAAIAGPSRSASVYPSAAFGIDFSPASLAAARWASRFVVPDIATLVHVVAAQASEDATDPRSVRTTESLRHLTPALAGGLGGFAATLAVPSVRNVVRIGRPSHWLPVVAADAGASLLVLGRRGDANRMRFGEPNVIERVTRRTSASVLLVPEGVALELGCVVAAVDDSPLAPEVLDVSRRLARSHEIPLVVLQVVSPLSGAYARVLRVPHRAVADWDDVRGADRTAIAIGDPVREIMATAARCASPLVVVGVRGEDRAADGSVGSVARELLARSWSPMLVVR